MMAVCKHFIPKLPYVNSDGILSNDTGSVNTGFTLCFAFQTRAWGRSVMLSSVALPASHCMEVNGGIKALGRQQVVCFYSLSLCASVTTNDRW